MKVKKTILVVLVLIFTSLLLLSCAKNITKDTNIGEYFDTYLGVTYNIYKKSNESGDTFYAKVSSVLENTRFPDISITIPQTITYNDTVYDVTTIGDLAFYMSNFDIIYIPEGVTTIEKYAFDRAKATKIDLPSTITSIGEYAFSNCVSLQEINLTAIIPPSVGQFAFMVYDQKTNSYINSPILRINVPTTAKKRYTDINNYPQWELYQGNIR